MSSLDELFTGIADAIREKRGTTDKMTATSFPQQISYIETLNGEPLSVTPSTETKIYNPSSSCNAITQVEVKGVTCDIDENIKPQNIKKDVSILGILGELEGGSANDADLIDMKNRIEDEGGLVSTPLKRQYSARYTVSKKIKYVNGCNTDSMSTSYTASQKTSPVGKKGILTTRTLRDYNGNALRTVPCFYYTCTSDGTQTEENKLYLYYNSYYSKYEIHASPNSLYFAEYEADGDYWGHQAGYGNSIRKGEIVTTSGTDLFSKLSMYADSTAKLYDNDIITVLYDPNDVPEISDIQSGITSITGLLGEQKTVTATASRQYVYPSSGKNAITRVTVEPVTSAIDADITPANIRKDIDILGVIGTLEEVHINNQNKEITQNGTYTADSGYTGLGSVTVNVTSGGAEGGIRQFSTIEEMNNYTQANNGDLAITYFSSITNAGVDSEFQTCTFPETVVLPSAVTSSIQVSYRAIGDTVFVDGWGQLSSTMFRIDFYADNGNARVQYTSTDGITYTRSSLSGSMVNGNDVDLGTPVCFTYTEDWNDAIGYFIQLGGSSFEGLYVFDDGVWSIAPTQLNVSLPSHILPGKTAYGGNGLVTGNDDFYNNTFDRKILNNVIGDNNFTMSEEGVMLGTGTVGIPGELVLKASNSKNYDLLRLKNATEDDYLTGYIDENTQVTFYVQSGIVSGNAAANTRDVSRGPGYIMQDVDHGSYHQACAICDDGTTITSKFNVTTSGGFSGWRMGTFVHNGSMYEVAYYRKNDSDYFTGLRIYKLSSTGYNVVYSTSTFPTTGYPHYIGFLDGVVYIYYEQVLYKYNVDTNTMTNTALTYPTYNGTYNICYIDNSIFALTYPTYPYTYWNFIRIKDGVITEGTIPADIITNIPTPVYIDETGEEPIYYLKSSGKMYKYSNSTGTEVLADKVGWNTTSSASSPIIVKGNNVYLGNSRHDLDKVLFDSENVISLSDNYSKQLGSRGIGFKAVGTYNRDTSKYDITSTMYTYPLNLVRPTENGESSDLILMRMAPKDTGINTSYIYYMDDEGRHYGAKYNKL